MELKITTRRVVFSSGSGRRCGVVASVSGLSVSQWDTAEQFGGIKGSDGKSAEFESRNKLMRFLNDCLLNDFPPRGES